MKKILITGAAGFIGFHLSRALCDNDYTIYGIDNLNDYYSPQLKKDRLAQLKSFDNFHFSTIDITNKIILQNLFNHFRPDIVINLAAQAGVRHSINHPEDYIDSNVIGFFNILESCRKYDVKHLIYASSSSVYGEKVEVPFSENDKTDEPTSLYAASKKANEAMAYSYSHLYQLPCTALRFFTVYGPWGRPDMAYYKFTRAIISGQTIRLYDNGHLFRDFTYIDDVVNGICKIVNRNPGNDLHRIYNIGKGKPDSVREMVDILEWQIGHKAIVKSMPRPQSDCFQTFADTSKLHRDYDYTPSVSLVDGLKYFYNWYQSYHKHNSQFNCLHQELADFRG